MITLYLMNSILIAHFISDFVFQNRWLTDNKNSMLKMFVHSITYTVIFGLIFYAATYTIYDFELIASYVILNGFLHYAVDLLIGIIKKLQMEQDYLKLTDNGFYATIGFDQLLHLIILFHTFNYMFN